MLEAKQEIREHCRQQFLKALRQIQEETKANSSECVLVLDQQTKPIISSLFSVAQLLNAGVLVLEKLELQRRPFPNANGVYYVSPTKKSLELIGRDYEDKEDPKYLSVSLLFSGELSRQLMEELGENEKIVKRLAAFREYHCDLLFLAAHVMSLQMSPQVAFKEIDRVAENLFIACSAFPNRYAFEIVYSQQSKKSEALALKLAELLEKQNLEPSNDTQLITVLLLERKLDPVSPLLRSMSYEPLLKDLFRAVNNKLALSAPGVNPPEVKLLDPSDRVYCKYRYRHLSQVVQDIKKDLKAELEGSEAAKFQRSEQGGNLSATIKELPEFNRTKLSYNFNLDLIGKLNDLVAKRSLVRLVELELAIVTGFNSQGEEQSEKTLVNGVLEQLNSKVTDPNDKHRLIALALMCLELKGKERQQFLSSLKEAFPSAEKGIQELCPKRFRLRDKKSKKQQETILLGNRHHPALIELMSGALTHKDQVGTRVIRINNIQDKQVKPGNKLGVAKQLRKENLLVYVAGGLGYNEICEAEKLNLANCFYASSLILTPVRYLQQLSEFAA